MKKWTTAMLLLFLATALGICIWYFFQKDYHPALRSEENAKAESAEKPEMKEEVVATADLKAEDSETDNVREDVCHLPSYNRFGVMLTAENVTPEGMTLVCTQSGGDSTGELSTGGWYVIETEADGQWQEVPRYAEVCWEDLAWIIQMDGRTQWEVNWTWLYDSLPEGEYRMAKEIMDFRQSGDYDTCITYAYFTVE
nr:hypothetical protein [Lachnospiraceae bacterium]